MASQSTQPPATNPAPQELTNNDLALLLNTLNPVASKCFALGLHLGVTYPELRKIEYNYRRCEDQLREIISERLRQESPLTWYEITRALIAVSENRLASEIENKYIHHLPPPASVAPQANTVSLASSSLTSLLQSSSQCDTSPLLAHSSASVASTPLQYSPRIHSINRQYPPPSTSASLITTAIPQHSGTASIAPSHEYTSYSDIIDRHCVALTDAIHGDLVAVSNKFLELGFVTRTATGDILSKNGISSREKATELLSLVTLSHDRSHDKKEWFDKFTSVFSSEAAYEGLVSELKEASHKMMGSATLVPRPHHKWSAKTHRRRKVVSGSSDSFSQTTKRLQMSGHDSDNEPMKVRKKGRRAEGSIEVKKKKKSSHDGRSSSMTLIGRGVMSEKSSSVRIEKRGRGGPTTRAREELSSKEEEGVYQGTEQRSFSEFTSESEDNRQGRRAHEHTSESSSSSAESSALTSSSAEEEEGKRPDSRYVSRKKRRRRNLATWSTPKKRKLFKGGGRKRKGRQLQHTSSGHHSEQYLNDRDPPQSVRQSPGREHYQSQQGPTTAGPRTTHKQNSSSGSGSPVVKLPMDLFMDYVRSTYRQSAIEKNLNVIKWPPTPCEVFISLAYIDRSTKFTKSEVDGYTRAMVEDGNIDVILKKKDCSIDFDDIARGLPQTDSSQKVILVEGAPGVGKSTFAWEFCRRWERGEIAQQYQLVLLLRLRDDSISKAKSLGDLIYHPRPDICQGVLHDLLSNGGVNTLIILDGFDELPDDQRKNSFYSSFLAKCCWMPAF